MAAGAFEDDPLTLVDVGCALGIEQHWRAFPLRARAIDPMIGEIERLRALETDPNVEYVAGFIKQPGFPSVAEREQNSSNTAFRRSSSYAQTLKASREGTEAYNAWQDTRHSEVEVTLDEFAVPLGRVDFVKTDTDGGDLEVLHSGSKMLKSVLGVHVETILGSSSHPLSNSRSNIDQYLVGQGFALFDEQIYRYSRAALPDRFLYKIPAQTNRGQVIWSQCLYLRDMVANLDAWPDGAVRKMVGIFELFELNDCAAELIELRPGAIAEFVEPQAALDLLTKEWLPEFESHAALKTAFDEDASALYPLSPARAE